MVIRAVRLSTASSYQRFYLSYVRFVERYGRRAPHLRRGDGTLRIDAAVAGPARAPGCAEPERVLRDPAAGRRLGSFGVPGLRPDRRAAVGSAGPSVPDARRHARGWPADRGDDLPVR